MYFLFTISAVASISSIPLSFFFDLTDGYSGVHKEIPSSVPTPVWDAFVCVIRPAEFPGEFWRGIRVFLRVTFFLVIQEGRRKKRSFNVNSPLPPPLRLIFSSPHAHPCFPDEKVCSSLMFPKFFSHHIVTDCFVFSLLYFRTMPLWEIADVVFCSFSAYFIF